MPTGAIRPSTAVGTLLRGRRKQLGLTLHQVSERLAASGERVPLSTIARIEQGKLDPGVRRLHRLLRLYDLPPHLVADVLDLEDVASAEPLPSGDLETLYREGVEYWKQGNVARGMAHLMAVRRHVPADPDARLLRQKATLAFAINARDLGMIELAEQTVRGLLREHPDPSILVNVLVFTASVWAALDAPEAALAFVTQAEARLDPAQRARAGWVYHQKAKVLLRTGDLDAATAAVEEARRAYRETGDTFDEAKLGMLEIDLHTQRGDLDRALWCARRAVKHAEEHGHSLVLVHARLRLGGLLVRQGDVETGLDALRQSLAQAILLRDRQAEFLAHYHLWKAYVSLGDGEQARLEFESASYFVRFVQDVSPEAEEIRTLSPIGGRHAKPNEDPAPSRRR